jgi:hypothetical protein
MSLRQAKSRDGKWDAAFRTDDGISATPDWVWACVHAQAAKICALKIFFIIFVDGIFTTFIRPPFTNTSDAIRENHAASCV